MAGERLFGILLQREGDPGEPQPGMVGCTVEVLTQEQLADGRSNILCAGRERFMIGRIVPGAEYYEAEVDTFDDAVGRSLSSQRIEKAKDLFLRIIAAGKQLRDPENDASEPQPELPEDPVALSFLIAASIDSDLEVKQRWLEMTSTSRRLSILTNLLSEVVDTYELRASVDRLRRGKRHDSAPPEQM